MCVCVCVCVVRWGWRNRIIEDQLSCWQTVFIQEGVSPFLSTSRTHTHTRASVSRALQPSIREGHVRGVCEHVCVCVCVLMDSLKWAHETKKKERKKHWEGKKERAQNKRKRALKWAMSLGRNKPYVCEFPAETRAVNFQLWPFISLIIGSLYDCPHEVREHLASHL